MGLFSLFIAHFSLGWFPRWIRPLVKLCVQGMFEQRSLNAFGWSNPPALVRNLVEKSLKLRGYVSRWLLPRRKPDFLTESNLKTYPHGYRLNNLGPTKMLAQLRNENQSSLHN